MKESDVDIGDLLNPALSQGTSDMLAATLGGQSDKPFVNKSGRDVSVNLADLGAQPSSNEKSSIESQMAQKMLQKIKNNQNGEDQWKAMPFFYRLSDSSNFKQDLNLFDLKWNKKVLFAKNWK